MIAGLVGEAWSIIVAEVCCARGTSDAIIGTIDGAIEGTIDGAIDGAINAGGAIDDEIKVGTPAEVDGRVGVTCDAVDTLITLGIAIGRI